MQQRAVHFTPDDPGLDQVEEAADQHFAEAVEAFPERRFLDRHGGNAAPVQPMDKLPIGAIVLVAQDERLGQRVADRADADLDRAAVLNQARGMQRSGIVAQRHWLVGRSVKRELAGRSAQQMGEITFGNRRIAAHERQLVIHLTGEKEIRAALPAGAQQIERQIRIAAQAVMRPAVDSLRR